MSYLKPPYAQANRGVIDRWVSASGDAADEAHWHYTADYASQNGVPRYVVSVTSPDGSRTERLLHAGPSLDAGSRDK